MDFNVRDIRPGEVSELRKLARPNFSFVEQCFISKPKLGIVAQTKDGKIAGGAFLVTSDSGKKKVGCIDIIFVLPQYRGSGVGKLLYHEAVKVLHREDCEIVFALVRGDNSQSLCRFKSEGIQPVSLWRVTKILGFKGTASLFIKTASLACATGCWILSDCYNSHQCIGSSKENISRVFLVNGLLLTLGSIITFLRQGETMAWWNGIAAIMLLALLTAGETIGRHIAGGEWSFVMPEGGLVPSSIVAILGGFYPMAGHWYLKDRKNSPEYKKAMAIPAKGAWMLLLIGTAAGEVFSRIHPVCACVSDLGIMLLVFYMLPFYPFDTFGGKRIKEGNVRNYSAFVAFSLILISLILAGNIRL